MSLNVPAIIDAGTVVEDFTDTTKWTKDANISALQTHRRCLDDVDKKGVDVTHANQAAAVEGFIWRTDKNFSLADAYNICIDYAVGCNFDTVGAIYKLEIEFSSVVDFSKSLVSCQWASVFSIDPKQRITLKQSDFTALNGEIWANQMVAIRLHVTPYATTFGVYGAMHLYMDKIVKNRHSTPLVVIGVDVSNQVGANAMMTEIDNFGFNNKVFASFIDYDNQGDVGYSTWADIAHYANVHGVDMQIMMTAWLLYAPFSAVRPVPPYPAENLLYSDVGDGTPYNRLQSYHYNQMINRAAAIHEFYGLLPGRYTLNTHGGFLHNRDGISWFEQSGFHTLSERSDWTALLKGTVNQGFPVYQGIMYWNIHSSTATHANVMTAIDEAVDKQTYLCLQYNCALGTTWVQADLEAEWQAIQNYETAGSLQVVSLYDFLSLAQEPCNHTPNQARFW